MVFGIIGIAAGDNASFALQPLKDRIITLNLKETDSVSGSFSVVSNDETGINFFVTDPYNNTILQYDNVFHRDFSFTAESEGSYQMRFDNSLSSAYSKTISVNYNVTHYIFGLPQEQFLFILIAVVALIGIVLFVMLTPKS
jgi:hypothetical protein